MQPNASALLMTTVKVHKGYHASVDYRITPINLQSEITLKVDDYW